MKVNLKVFLERADPAFNYIVVLVVRSEVYKKS